jgi:hypothetical protein
VPSAVFKFHVSLKNGMAVRHSGSTPSCRPCGTSAQGTDNLFLPESAAITNAELRSGARPFMRNGGMTETGSSGYGMIDYEPSAGSNTDRTHQA